MELESPKDIKLIMEYKSLPRLYNTILKNIKFNIKYLFLRVKQKINWEKTQTLFVINQIIRLT
jgi:ssDNA-specific exonuclease RecJ